MFNMDLYLCVLTFVLTNVYVLNLMHVHIHNDLMSRVLIFMLHVLITCWMLVFIKARIYTCTTSEPQIDHYMFVLERSFVPIRCTSIV